MTGTRRRWLTAGIIATATALALQVLPSSGASNTHTMYACIQSNGQPRGVTYMRLDVPPTTCSKTDTIYSWTVDPPASTPTTTVATTTSAPTTSTSTSTSTPTTTTTVPAATLNVDKPFSVSSSWNTPTPTGTQWFDTSVLHIRPSVTTGDNFRHWWVNTGGGVYYASATDPVWTFQMPNYVAAGWNRNRPATSFTMRAPAGIAPNPDADHTLDVIEPDGSYVEVWQAAVNPTTMTVTSTGPGWATGNMITGTGVGGFVAQGGNNAGTRAANLSNLAGRISTNDVTGTGPIDHALSVALPYDMLMGGATPVQNTNFRVPATACDCQGQGPIMMGSKIGIPAGTAMPSGLSPLGVKVFNALQGYGAYASDYTGGNWPVLQSDYAVLPDGNPMCSLYCYWDYGNSSDMEKIGPLLRVADYQP